MDEIRKKAKEIMNGTCRMCRICDGRACAGEVPGMGGTGTGASFRNNVEALKEFKLNLRTIHQAVAPKTGVDLLGVKLEMPVLGAPVAGVSFNMGGGRSEEEYVRAFLGGCREKGVLGCCGDGAQDDLLAGGLKAVTSLGGWGIPVLKPWSKEELGVKLEAVRESGARLVGMDIDAAGLITLALMGKPVSPKTPEELRKIIGGTDLKVILKGIMTPDEAKLAMAVGAAGIVVSNHGGRILDHTPGTAEVLPGIARAVKGRIAILADGGVRSGGDVAKMLALGADAVMIGRPLAVAAMGGLEEGVGKYLDTIKTELIQTMILTGCPDIASVGPRILYNPPFK